MDAPTSRFRLRLVALALLVPVLALWVRFTWSKSLSSMDASSADFLAHTRQLFSHSYLWDVGYCLILFGIFFVVLELVAFVIDFVFRRTATK